MIIDLTSAKKIDPDIEQSDLDAMEIMIRHETNNSFINHKVSYTNFVVSDVNTLTFTQPIRYIRSGDTILLAYTWTSDSNGGAINNGVYTVESVDGNTVILSNANLFLAHHYSGLLAKVEYPDDILMGVKKLIEYRVKTADNLGIKSRTIARMSESYVDVNASDNSNGYPSALFGFLDKYRKLRW